MSLFFETTNVVSSFTQKLGCGFMEEEKKGEKRGRELSKKSLAECICDLGGGGMYSVALRSFFLRRAHHILVSPQQSKEQLRSELV